MQFTPASAEILSSLVSAGRFATQQDKGVINFRLQCKFIPVNSDVLPVLDAVLRMHVNHMT